MDNNKQKLPRKDDLVNQDIRFREVNLIGPDGPIGIMSSREAQAKATEAGLDLVCISPNANPPVCKILDYGKYRFEKQKKEKQMRQNQTIQLTKEVRLTPNIGAHDLETKAKNAIKFLEQGNKVKVSLQFRGRERAHQQVGEEVLKRFAEICNEFGTISTPAILNGRFLDMILAPTKKK